MFQRGALDLSGFLFLSYFSLDFLFMSFKYLESKGEVFCVNAFISRSQVLLQEGQRRVRVRRRVRGGVRRLLPAPHLRGEDLGKGGEDGVSAAGVDQ